MQIMWNARIGDIVIVFKFEKLGRLVAKANVLPPQNEKEEAQLVQRIQFAQHLSTNQRMLIARLLLTVDEEDEANKFCKQEDLNIDDAETLVSEILSQETRDDDYEPSFIDDEDYENEEEEGDDVPSLIHDEEYENDDIDRQSIQSLPRKKLKRK